MELKKVKKRNQETGGYRRMMGDGW